MANRSTNNSKGLNKITDGHILDYFRSTFGSGGGAAITVLNTIYYAFTSPGSINLSSANPLGFSWTSSPDATFKIITISSGSSGQNALFPGAPSGPNSTGTGSGGGSGTVKVLVSEPIAPYGSSIPITVGNVPVSGVGIGSTSGGDRGSSPNYPTSTSGFAGTSIVPIISSYTPLFPDYSFSSTGGAGGNTAPPYYATGGGGGAGGIVITTVGSSSPTKSIAPVAPAPTASNGNPGGTTGGGPANPGAGPRPGGGGGSGGVGYGAGGGGGGGPVENWGANSPGGTGGAGAGGILLVIIQGNLIV